MQYTYVNPLLFLLYINDLPTGAKIILFADDTNLFVSTKTINELEYKASFYLKNLNNWLNANRLHLNIDMTCYSILSPIFSLYSNYNS